MAHINEYGNTATKFDNKQAKILPPHPWSGAIADCLGCRMMGGAQFMIFRDIESYTEFGVDNGKQVKWIDS